MGQILGLDAKLYYDVLGAGVGVWTLLDNCKDVALNLETATADTTTRATGGFRATTPTLKDGTIEFQMIYDSADAGFQALKDAFLANSTIGIAVMDGLIASSGTEGFQADMRVSNFSINQALEDVVMVDVSLVPTQSTFTPAWVVIP